MPTHGSPASAAARNAHTAKSVNLAPIFDARLLQLRLEARATSGTADAAAPVRIPGGTTIAACSHSMEPTVALDER